MVDKTQILLESLRRTDSYTLAADQKASFCLAAAVTFLGIYSTLFYTVITDDKAVISTTLTISILGLVLLPWLVFFYSIKSIFSPNLKPSEKMSIISFASIASNTPDLEHFKNYYKSIEINDDIFVKNINEDLLENHWICSEICFNKMKNFKKCLHWLWVALSVSLIGLAILVYFVENNEFINFLSICQ
jgi:hypothetical protein